MRELNKKGFTLIELLAVIVILGVIMLIAIPMVTSYIENAKKDAFLDNAKMAIKQARNDLLSQSAGNCTFKTGQCIIMDTSEMNFENNFTSPYGNAWQKSLVQVCESDGVYTYSYAGVDTDNNGIESFKTEKEINTNDREIVKKGNAAAISASATCHYSN